MTLHRPKSLASMASHDDAIAAISKREVTQLHHPRGSALASTTFSCRRKLSLYNNLYNKLMLCEFCA
jgi:hypothetical protein